MISVVVLTVWYRYNNFVSIDCFLFLVSRFGLIDSRLVSDLVFHSLL